MQAKRDTHRPATSPPGTPREVALLLAGTPREVLARIVPGDPLGVRPRTAAALRRRALLFDGDRVFLRAMVVCARSARSWAGRPALDTWLAHRIDAAIEELLAEDEEGLAGPGDAAVPPLFALLAGPLRLDPSSLAEACRRFHRLPEADREAFFLLVLEGRSLEETCAAQGRSAPACARAARRALEVLLETPSPSRPERFREA